MPLNLWTQLLYRKPEYGAYPHRLCRDRFINRVLDHEGIDCHTERRALLNCQRAGSRYEAFERVVNEGAVTLS